MKNLPRLKQRLWPWLRLSLYVSCLCILSTWWWVRHVSANAHARALEMGHELEKLRDIIAGTTTLTLNGQRVTLSAVSTDQNVTTILDKFTASCSQASGGVKEEL